MPESTPLNSVQQAELEQLCESLERAPRCSITDVADQIAKANLVPQERARDELLAVYCRRALQDHVRITESSVADKLVCSPDAVRRAMRIAADSVTTSNGVPAYSRRYEFQQALGRGGFGRVGLYRDTLLDQLVAIKLPRSPKETAFSGGALEETKKTLTVRSSRVIQIRDICYLWDEWDDPKFLTHAPNNPASPDPDDPFFAAFRPAIVMEYAERKSLDDRINKVPWNPGNVIKVFTEIARGVGDVHKATLTHRDLKPKNILFGADGLPRVSDFGLAESWLQTGSTRAGGTPLWMAPEVLDGWVNGSHVPPRVTQDIWSLGVILYQLLTAKHPFDGADYQRRISAANYEPVHGANPALDERWNRIVASCLHRDPGRRCASIDDLLDEMDQAGQGDRHSHHEKHDHQEVHYHYHGVGVPPEASPGSAHDGASGNDGRDGGGGPPYRPSSPGGDGSDSPSGPSFRPSFVGPEDKIDRRVANLFVGHEDELNWLDSVFGASPGTGTTRTADAAGVVALLHGMPGCGKTYLIDRWLWRRSQADGHNRTLSVMPTVTLVLERGQRVTLDRLRETLAGRWNLPLTNQSWSTIRGLLQDSILRIQNVDDEAIAETICELTEQLDGCRVLLCGRWFDPGRIPPEWHQRAMPLL
ncbi:MAG: serine/threonine protein kinase, partial [Planctomycetaceae bacterium]|nr:serine/threonine protein kinase [Planctomycetaceae bacterium]